MMRGRSRRVGLIAAGSALLASAAVLGGADLYAVAEVSPPRQAATTAVDRAALAPLIADLLAVPAPPEPPPPPPPQRGLAQAAVDAAQAAAGSGTELAAAVFDRATGELATGARGDEPYYTASLSKLVVAVDVVDRRRLEGLAVTEADLDLIRRALGPSDDSAMSILWDRFDGAGAAARVSARLGLTGTSAPLRGGQWGEMNVPASDTVRLWSYVLDELPAPDRDLLVTALGAAPPTARDGFDQAFGLLSPAVDGRDGVDAIAKQGWMCCFSGRYYLHSAGAVRADQRFLVALLTRVPRGPGWEAGRQELDRIAEATVAPLP